ncbi:MAG TPA: TRAP transporter small permease [Syntrophorhabdaceae bacterium]|nr:TRAP transporter small permease [Syntrophorhabdaceae bacterium]
MRAFVAGWKKCFGWMNSVAELALFIMMLLTVIDVILRRFFGSPIVGTYDLVAMIGAIVVGFAVPKTSWDRGHVFVDVLLENRTKVIKNGFFVVTRIVGIVLFALLSYYLFQKGMFLLKSGETSMTLRVPVYPVAFALSLCFLIQCFSLITDIFRTFHIGEPI